MKDYHKMVHQLEKLKQVYPHYSMGRHLSSIIGDRNVWGMGDGELSGLFDEYVGSLVVHSDSDVEDIINQGMCLDRFKLYEDASPYEDE